MTLECRLLGSGHKRFIYAQSSPIPSLPPPSPPPAHHHSEIAICICITMSARIHRMIKNSNKHQSLQSFAAKPTVTPFHLPVQNETTRKHYIRKPQPLRCISCDGLTAACSNYFALFICTFAFKCLKLRSTCTIKNHLRISTQSYQHLLKK